MRIFLIGAASIALIVTTLVTIAATQLPAIGAGALLFPSRHVSTRSAPAGCVHRIFNGFDLTLDGWECKTTAAKRHGTIVYLHGIADNRGSAAGVIATFLPLGFDVIAYDGRGHGKSQGDICTYGYFEKRDLQRVLDQINADKVILIGHSLGAAIALQAAAVEPRVKAVVAASSFSDLRTIATERAFYFPSWSLAPAFTRAEHDGHFIVDEVSPVKAAAQITAPVFVIHGANDRDTLPAHSRRVYEALRGDKRFLLVPNAAHNDVLNSRTLEQIENWLTPLFPN